MEKKPVVPKKINSILDGKIQECPPKNQL